MSDIEDGSEDRDGKGSGDDEAQQPDVRPVGFWDEELSAMRKEVFVKWALTTLILCAFILSILSLYWGVLFRVEKKIYRHSLSGSSTSMIVKAAEALVAPSGALGWGSLPASRFGHDPLEVRRQIYEFGAWAAIIINANATALLQEAVIYVQARDESTYFNYIIPELLQFQSTITSKFGEQWTSQVLEQAATNASIMTNIRNSPQVISPAIGFSTFNLRPFRPTCRYTCPPKFYYWGYAWPLHNLVEASRQILFDLHSRIGLNFGVLFTWVAVNTVLFPACCYFMRWNTLKAEDKKMDKKGNAKEDGEEEMKG
ncbi:hypothetical protein DID88_010261 [Monilinia fructigena]|uniref:DUF3533 domain-containing protein n=1 Tax=Monilinia fructigena TaxID=38457 RepID=A0A395ILE2_9HELO|nr:hypothetical protein DID88_010261 [Monilinia fructigena]